MAPQPRSAVNPTDYIKPISPTIQDTEGSPPDRNLILAFVLSLLPVIGLVGAGLAIYDLWQSKRTHMPAHGLAYGALVLQVFYILIIITLVTVVFRIDSFGGLAVTTNQARNTRQVLLANQKGDTAIAYSLVDSEAFDDLESELSAMRVIQTEIPKLIAEENVTQLDLRGSSVRQKYLAKPGTFLLWRVGQSNSSIHYVAVTMGEAEAGNWRIVSLTSVDAPSDNSALKIITALAQENSLNSD
ncbi:hypothetical protein KBC99_02495 [Candidatus Saccharibacteria bacterium]|nr:hypothetical protein [Candidatus Saccharibacteria bacterium]